MEPTFPLRIAPTCYQCGRPCTRQITSSSNRNGNAGRPYYTCINGGHNSKFSTFDDSRGIFRENPQCLCGYMSRRVRRNGTDRGEFYCCPVGGCQWFNDVPATTARPAVGSDGNWFNDVPATTARPAIGSDGNWFNDVPATTARPAVGSNGNWSGETASNWSGETMPAVGAAVYWSRETTPETHTVGVRAGCSYVKDSPAPEVITIAAPKTSTTFAAVSGDPRHDARTQFNLEAQTFGSGMRPAYRNRRRCCCVMM